MPEFRRSTRKGKKYMVKYQNTWIHFGAIGYGQFRDSTGLGLYSGLDHNDAVRQKSYFARFGPAVDKSKAMYYSHKYLWS
jgi:hypothetical protein